MAGFEDLLQRAEELSSGLDANLELPHVQKSFRQLLDAGQRLCSKSTQQQDDMQVKASLLLCTEGQDIPKISDKIKVISSTTETFGQLQDTSIEGYLQTEHENAILGAVETQKANCLVDIDQQHWKLSTKQFVVDRRSPVQTNDTSRNKGITTSWEGEKNSILKKLVGSDGTLKFVQDLSAGSDIETFNSIGKHEGLPSTMHPVELVYADKVMEFTERLLNGKPSAGIGTIFENSMSNLKQEDAVSIWQMVNHTTAAADQIQGHCDDSYIVQRAQSYLEETYRDYMFSSVYTLAPTSELGGAPSTLNLVKSFLKISPGLHSQGCDEETIDGLSVWAVIFYCLRCGDLDMAKTVVQAYENIFPDFSMWINEYIEKGRKLSVTARASMKIQFKHTVRSSSDIHKIAVYSVIGKFDFTDENSHIVKRTEDYLWFKLCQVSTDIDSETTDDLTLKHLQHLISTVYGENHFHANDNPWLYFKVMFLTHQFEAALEFLSRFEFLLPHAVHIALALYINGQLKISEVQAKLLNEIHDKNFQLTSCQLNIARLVMLYTQRFELGKPSVAICYYYLIRDIKVEGYSFFEKCLHELVQETAEYDLLLGKLNADGSRRVGLIDKYCSNTKKIISQIAEFTESKGLHEDAILLHDLSGNVDKVLNLLNRLLSATCSKNDQYQPDRPRIKKLALDIAHRYQKQGVETSASLLSTFHLLLDLVAFFDLYHSERHDQALDVLTELQLLPLDTEQVSEVAQRFKMYSDEIRQNISPLLLAAMNLLTKRSQSVSNKERSVLKKSARALIIFAGMLPYHLPADTTSVLVKQEVQIK